MSGGHSVNSLDTTSIEVKNPGIAALPFKAGEQVVPCTEEFAAIIADNPSVGLRVSGDPQADRQAVGIFQVMIEILGGHGGAQLYAAIANTSEQGVSVF